MAMWRMENGYNAFVLSGCPGGLEIRNTKANDTYFLMSNK